MHLDVHGEGPAVLLLHGIPSTTRAFDGLVRALAPRHRVLVPELPGYGRSPRLPGAYSFARVNDLLVAELRSRGVERCALVGFSGGAYRALMLALSGKIEVTSIVTLGGLAGFDEPVRAGYRELAAAVRGGLALRPIILERMTSPGFAASHPAEAAEIVTWADATTPDVLADELAAIADDEDLRPRLSSIACRVVARVGALDAAAPPPFSEDIARGVPNGSLQVVAGCGHALMYEDTAATERAVVDAVAVSDRGA